MKHFKTIASAAMLAAVAVAPTYAERLVILHTNDTHSQIDPAADGLGGVLRRKVVVDSVRDNERNVLLVDAGDVVQGTLYFTLYGGEVEQKAMNAMRYDLAILGNHEFDNGQKALAKYLDGINAQYLTTNYDLRGTDLDRFFLPYVIKEYGGKRIAFMALNVLPEGLISPSHSEGIEYIDPYKAANATAWSLKHNERADMVVALSHIGYTDRQLPCDSLLAANSEDIDIIIGGHTHTLVDPADPAGRASLVKNLNGKEVIVAQTGELGKRIGKIDIDLDSLTAEYSLIPIDSRLDSRIDSNFEEVLRPYKAKVDSLMNVHVATAVSPLSRRHLANLFADLMLRRGQQLAGSTHVDMALINNGGIRNAFPSAEISEGNVIMTLPFKNCIELVRIKGADLLAVFDETLERNINGVSANVDARFNPEHTRCTEVTIDGKPIDPEKYYVVATLDYLADGGDHLRSFRKGEILVKSPAYLREDMISMMKQAKGKLNPSDKLRIHS